MMDGSQIRRRIPLLVWVLVPAALILVAAANAHLVWVSIASQPECVDHLKEPGRTGGQFRAAKSAC